MHQCSVCLGGPEDGHVFTPSCSHLIHAMCARELFSRPEADYKCPTCRAPMSINDLTRLSEAPRPVPTVWCFCSCGSGVQRMVGGHSFAYRCLHCQRTVPYEDQCFEIHTIRPHCFVHGERVLTVKFYDRSWYERGWVCIDPLTYDATDLCNHVVFDRIHFY